MISCSQNNTNVLKLRLLPVLLLVVVVAQLTACASWYTQSPPPSDLPDHYESAGAAELLTFTSADKLTLFGQWWLPAGEQTPRAIVLLVHGSMVHSGFYLPWANYLTEHGYAVLGIDLRGWGQSQGFGRRGFVLNYSEYVRDLTLAYQAAKSRFPELPLFIQGESMGGVVVLLSQLDTSLPADGLVLNAPAMMPAMRFGALQTPDWLASFGFWLVSIPGDPFPNHPLLLPGPVVEMFGGFVLEDEAALARYREDKFVVHDTLPLSYLVAMKDAGKRVQASLGKIHTPLIVLHGTRDSLVPMTSSLYIMKFAASKDKTLKQYDGMNHGTLHDIGHVQVWQDIVHWLDAEVDAKNRKTD